MITSFESHARLVVTAYPLSEAEVGADERQRHGHSEPKSQQRDQRAERHRTRASLAPQDEIHHEKESENRSASKVP